MRRQRVPPLPVWMSLTRTLVVLFVLAGVVVAAVSASVTAIDPVASLIFRWGLCLSLLWVELHRQKMRHFLAAVGVSRRYTLLALSPAFIVLELAYRTLGGS